MTHPARSNLKDGSVRSAWALGAAMLTVLAGTLLLYEPWRGLPFDILDFSEFLPFLHNPTFASRWHAFVDYYASQGRWNVLSYLVLITKWSVFGSDTVGWQFTRFLQMWCIMAGVYVALRVVLRADRWGAAAGAGLFAVSSCTSAGWMRLTMGEPLGFVFLLGALLVAARYRSTARWLRDGLALAVLVALALLAKEMLVVFVPFVVVIGCCVSAPGELAWPRWDRRTGWLAVCTMVGVLAVLIPVAIVWRRAPPANFASQFARRQVTLDQLADNFALVLLPVTRSRPAVLSLFTTPANGLFLTVVLAGWGLEWRHRAATGTSRWMAIAWLALAVSLPVAVVVAYEPWSIFNDFYGLPYVFGSAMLLAGAVTAISRLASPTAAIAARWACLAILALTGVRASLPARQLMARREVNAAVAGYLATHSPGSPVMVMSEGFSGRHWPGTAVALGNYAAALYPAAGLPTFRFAQCALPPRPFTVDGRGGIVVSYADDCGTYAGATASFLATHQYLTLHPLALREDSLRVDVCDSSCTRKLE